VAGEGRTAAMRRPERGAPWRGRSHSRAFSSLSSLRLHSSLHPSPLASPPLSPLRIRRPARREHGGRRPVPGAGGVATTRPPMRRSASGRGRWQHDDEQGAPPVPTSAKLPSSGAHLQLAGDGRIWWIRFPSTSPAPFFFLIHGKSSSYGWIVSPAFDGGAGSVRGAPSLAAGVAAAAGPAAPLVGSLGADAQASAVANPAARRCGVGGQASET